MNDSLPLSFIRNKVKLGWSDITLGHKNKWINSNDVVALACESLSQGIQDNEILKLASMTEADFTDIQNCLERLKSEGPEATPTAEKKWLFVLLSWVYETLGPSDEGLDEVAAIYADFGYPAELALFVRYMPRSDVTSETDIAQARLKLEASWESYLQSAARIYGAE